MVALAFETYDVHRVFGRLEARNLASARVLEKLGMRREAHLVENEWVKGEWQSELVYALLATSGVVDYAAGRTREELEWRCARRWSGPGGSSTSTRTTCVAITR